MSKKRTDLPAKFTKLVGGSMSERSLHSSSPDKHANQGLGFLFKYAVLQIFYFCVYVRDFVLYFYHRLKIRFMNLSYHHNRTPQLILNDVVGLSKIPAHVGAIITLKDVEIEGGGIDGLLEDIGELSAWCLGAGVKQLTVYERSGALKEIPSPDVYRAVERKLESYYGIANRPTFALHTPHKAYTYVDGEKLGLPHSPSATGKDYHLMINLLSEEDGRESVVDLTKTLAGLAQKKLLKSADITVDVINKEMENLVTQEPDIVIIFGPRVDLQGFPPWQIRFSEIFHQPDNDRVIYPVFLKGLERYSACQINVGK